MTTEQVVSCKFTYDGASRIVDNIKLEEWNAGVQTIVGFEVRKSGKFSYKVKRYNRDKILDLLFIPPIPRSGPVIGRG